VMLHRSATDAVIGDVDRIVVVAPHPDDEVLATGLLLAAATELGIVVRVIAVTDGEAAYPGEAADFLAELRRGEQLAALREVGVDADAVHRLAIPDGTVADHVHAVALAIGRHCTTRTLVVAPTIHDWHPDHEACGLAARVADRTDGSRWSSLFWAHHHPQRLAASRPAMLRLAGSEPQWAARARAIDCHRSQFRHPDGHGEPILTAAHVEHLGQPIEYYVQERS
jgi:LmbE family N-acetylglucosaminyl deacetylase